MKYQGIIFDFNGVILWDDEWQNQAWQETARKLRGKELTQQEMRDNISGRTNREGFLYLLGREEIDDKELDAMIQEKEQRYRDTAIKQPDFKLSPGAVELFELLKTNNIAFTIATSSEINNVNFFFENLDLAKWFDFDKVVYDDGALPSKQAPDIFLRAAKKINLRPEECIVVEDAKSGISSAHHASMGKIIALNSTGKKQDMFKQLPEVSRIISKLSEITLEDFMSDKR